MDRWRCLEQADCVVDLVSSFTSFSAGTDVLSPVRDLSVVGVGMSIFPSPEPMTLVDDDVGVAMEEMMLLEGLDTEEHITPLDWN